MYYVYIIQSLQTDSFYKGFTLNPLLRLSFHNAGKSNYTLKKIPWKFVALFEFSSKAEALAKEKKIKKYPTKSLLALIKSEQNILNKYMKGLENC